MSGVYFDQRWFAPHGIGRFAKEIHSRLNGFRDVELSGRPTTPLDAITLARELKRTGATGYFSPGYNVPAWADCPVISTVHDLIHIQFPTGRSPLKSAYYRYVQRPMIRRAPVTLTVSEFSRRQIIQWYALADAKVVCVGNGVSESFRAQGPRIACDRPCVMYVGNLKRHKNVETLLAAVGQVKRRREVWLRLLVPEPNDELRANLDQNGLTEITELLPGMDDDQLAAYYRGSDLLVLPSHFEGFGLPLAEAMACGCPVLGADATSIPEVIGNAGELFDARSADDLADKINHILDDESLRRSMSQRGIDRASEFSWDQVAARVQRAVGPPLGLSSESLPLAQCSESS